MPEALYFTDDAAACELLADDPFALLMGFAIDQQVPVQKAFAGPLALKQRVGTLDPRKLAELDLEEAFREKPAIHRFPGSMAGRVRELAAVVAEDYGGDASRIWNEAADTADLKKRIGSLPGFGPMKVTGARLGAREAVRRRRRRSRSSRTTPASARSTRRRRCRLPGCEASAQGRAEERSRQLVMVRSQDHRKVDALRGVPLFAVLDRPDLETVERISSEIEVPAGEELIREGEPGRQFFVLLEGEAVVRRDGVEINRMTAGDFFGEIALLSDRPTTAAVETSSAGRVLVIAPVDFRQLLEDMPLLQMKVIQALADRLPDEFYALG